MGVMSQAAYRKIMKGIDASAGGDNLLVCTVWQKAEGASAENNAWNTTQPMPGATIYNTFGKGQHVYNYPTVDEGIEALVKSLLDGYYPAIVSGFRNKIAGLALCQEIDASVWGTKEAEAVWRSQPGVHVQPGPATHGWYHRDLYLRQPLMVGADVRSVQVALRNAGDQPGTVDGVFGKRSEAAVKAYQRRYHLTADGVVGSVTATAMGGKA